jgi:type II secretory pathway predicted ATPase ExeA
MIPNEGLPLEELWHHWGARHMPFAEGLTGELFLSAALREARELLDQTAALRSVMLLRGVNGVGKSVLVSWWLRGLEPKRFCPLAITQATLSGSGLLWSVAQRLGQTPTVYRTENLQRLEKGLAALGTRIPVVVLDEAQHYGPLALEEIRLLLGLNLPQQPLFALVLLGDAYLLDTLRLQSRRALFSRIAVSYQLPPLTPDQTRAYLQHRLEQAGLHRPVFEEPALELLISASDGIVRTLNLLATRAWLEAAKAQAPLIGPTQVQLALRQVPIAHEKITLSSTHFQER